MHKNFTQLFQVVSRAQNGSAFLASFLFMLLLVAKSASAQTITPVTQSACVGTNNVRFSAAFTASVIPNQIVWEYSSNNGASWISISPTTLPGGNISNNFANIPTAASTTELTLNTINSNYGGQYRAVFVKNNGPQNERYTTTSASATLTINLLPTAPSIANTSVTTVCSGGNAILTATGAPEGGSYNWYTVPTGGTAITTNLSEAGNATYSPILTNNTTAATTTSYYVEAVNPGTLGNCVSANRTRVIVTVNPLPVVSLAAFNNICTNAGAITLTGGSPAGGSYTVDGVAATTFDPATAGLGSHTIVYFFTQNNCTSSATQTITVLQAPSVNLDPFADVCANAPAFNLTSGSPAGGTYRVDGQIATTFNPATVTIGTHTITYSISGNGCISTTTQNITVLEAPAVSLAPFDAVCSSAGVITLTGGLPAGGSYTVDGQSATTFNPAVATIGDHTITYTFTQNGCTSVASQTITVNQTPVVTLAVFNNVCSNAEPFALFGGSPANGTYSGPGVSINGLFSPATAGVGTHDITYTFTQNGCTSFATQTITVVQAPSAIIIVPNTGTQVCTGGSVPLNVTAVSGAIYEWIRNNNEIIPGATTESYNANQTGSYRVRITSNGCITTSAAVNVTILEPASIITTGSLVPLCANTTTVLQALPGYSGYQWYKDGVILTGQTSPNLTVNATGDYTVQLTTNFTNCQAITSTITRVEVASEITNNSIITQNQPLCSGISLIIEALVPGGVGTTFSYQWQSSINNGPFTNIDTDDESQDYEFNPGNFIGNISFRRIVLSGACSHTSAPVTITVNPVLAGNTITTLNQSICVGSTLSIQAALPTGGGGTYIYQWQSSSTVEPNDFTDITTDGNNQNYTFSPGNTTGTRYFRRLVTSGGCTSNSGVVVITVNPALAGNTVITPNQAICAGASIGLLADLPTGGSGAFNYQWQSSNTGNANSFANVNASGNSQNYTFTPGSFTGTRYFQRVVTSGGCSSTSGMVAITVNPAISNNFITTPNQSICAGSSITIQAALPAGGNGTTYTYQWQSSNSSDPNTFNNIAENNTTSQTFNFNPGSFTGTRYFRRVVMSGTCISTSAPIGITVTPTTTYTLILTVAPADFPVCGRAHYIAKVFRNVTSVTYPEDPHYEQVTWVGTDDVTDQFLFDWWKNDNNDRVNGTTGPEINQAGLQSRDYYTVRARFKNASNPACVIYNNRPDLVPNNPGANVLFSNRIYLGMPDVYTVNIEAVPSGSICPGTSVTFTATPNDPNYVNQLYQWQVNGQNIQGATSSTFTSSTLINGDKVSVFFLSDEDKCRKGVTSNVITMVVATTQTLTGGGNYCIDAPQGGVAD
jgi:hypothetical protein